MSDNQTVILKKPVTVDGETHTKLTLRELTVDDLIILERQNGTKGQHEQDKYFFAMSCDVVPDVIGKLGQGDFTRLKTKFWETLGNVESEDEPSA